LAERQRIPGLPAARADVFLAALVTLLAVADLGGFAHFRNSLRNLRYGLADQALGNL
ncbi:MAG: phosphatase, partial [Opitutaceae bacterium]|nr:phosphatase [Opitutaceae bacterium]